MKDNRNIWDEASLVNFCLKKQLLTRRSDTPKVFLKINVWEQMAVVTAATTRWKATDVDGWLERTDTWALWISMDRQIRGWVQQIATFGQSCGPANWLDPDGILVEVLSWQLKLDTAESEPECAAPYFRPEKKNIMTSCYTRENSH